MVLTFILKIFLLQLVIFGIIILTLSILLNRQLKSEALKNLESLFNRNPQLPWQEISITTPRGLKNSLKKKVQDLAFKAWGKEPVIYGKTDPTIKGGVIFEFGDQRIDFSLRTRLRQSGILK